MLVTQRAQAFEKPRLRAHDSHIAGDRLDDQGCDPLSVRSEEAFD